jgi:hypothetical protein
LVLEVYTASGVDYSECIVGRKPPYSYETISTAVHILEEFIILSLETRLGVFINEKVQRSGTMAFETIQL